MATLISSAKVSIFFDIDTFVSRLFYKIKNNKDSHTQKNGDVFQP